MKSFNELITEKNCNFNITIKKMVRNVWVGLNLYKPV